MKKFLLVPSVLGLLFLAACTPASPATDADTDDTSDVMSSSPSSSAAMSSSVSADANIVEVSAMDSSFTPSTITVHKGDKLIVRLRGGEAEQSFGMKDFNINVLLASGETKDIEIPTDTAGSFEFRCLVQCGSGHDDMKGVIIVE